jgi:hypothetical protein
MVMRHPDKTTHFWRTVIVTVRVVLDIVAAGHDKNPALHANDLDLGTIKPRQHRPGDDFVDRLLRT